MDGTNDQTPRILRQAELIDMPGWQGLLFGLIGGSALEFLEVARVAKLPLRERKKSTHDSLFWFVRIGSALLGGAFGLGYAVSSAHPSEFAAITVGAAWPTIVGRAQAEVRGLPVKSR
jgi:hypothetical protein